MPHRLCELSSGDVLCMPASLGVTSTYVAREQRAWFEEELPYITEELTEPGSCVVDVGAGFGFYCTRFARRVGPTGHVFAFEPNTTTAALLKKTLFLNELSTQVTLSNDCVGSAGKEVLFKEDATTPELSRVVEEGGEVRSMITLDDLVNAVAEKCPPKSHVDPEVEVEGNDDLLLRVKSPVILRLDCCGAEVDCLKGGEKFIEKFSPIVVWAAADASGSPQYEEISGWLATKGYRTFRHLPSNACSPFRSSDDDDSDLSVLLNLISLPEWHPACTTTSSTPIFNPKPALSQIFAGLSTKRYATKLLKYWVEKPLQGSPLVEAFWWFNQKDRMSSWEARIGVLKKAKELFWKLCFENPTCGRLSCISRCLYELGEHALYVDSLVDILKRVKEFQGKREGKNAKKDLELDEEPFLPCHPLAEKETPSVSTTDTFFEATVRLAFVLKSALTSAFLPADRIGDVIEHLQHITLSGFFVDIAAARLTALYLRSQGKPQPIASQSLQRDRSSNGGFYPVHPIEEYCIPDLEQQKVLIVGTYEGFWAAECLKRGAKEVTVIGFEGEVDWSGVDVSVERVGVEREVKKIPLASLQEVTAEAVGTGYDMVVCMDQMQHARYPMRLVDELCKIGSCVYFTAVVHDGGDKQDSTLAAMQHCPAAGVWRPSVAALKQMALCAGFAFVEVKHLTDTCVLGRCGVAK